MTSPGERFRFNPRNVLGAGLFFTLTAIVMTWPLVRDLPHAVSDPGDPLFCTWVIHWDWHQIFHDPLHLFQANIFHPAKYTLAFSENLLGAAVFGFPLFFAGLAPITVYNVLFLLGMILSAWGAWALAAELTGDAFASTIAGMFFAFVPFRFDHLPHIQFQWGAFIPLAVLFLLRYFKSYSPRDLVLFGLFFVWNIYSCVYYGIYGSLAVALVLVLEGVRVRLWKNPRAVISLAVTLAVAGLIVVPILRPYSIVNHLYGFHRPMEQAADGAATLRSFLSAGFRNHLYGARTAGFALNERQLFYGLTVPLLAILGMILLRRRGPLASSESPAARTPRWLRIVDFLLLLVAFLRINYTATGGFHFGRLISVHSPFRLSLILFVLLLLRISVQLPWPFPYRNLADFLRRSPLRGPGTVALGLTLLSWMLAAGPDFFLYRYLYKALPFVIAGLRVPARAIVISHIGIGILAAFGLAFLRARIRPPVRWLAPALALALVAFEFRAAPIDFFHAETQPLQTSGWLRSHSFQGGALELPWSGNDDIEYVYRSTEHSKPILNGYSGFMPRFDNILESRLQLFPIPAVTFHLLEDLDCRLIVFHSKRLTPADARVVDDFLARGIQDGRITPIAEVHEPRDDAYIFATDWRSDPISPMPSAAELEKTKASTMEFLNRKMPD